MAQAMPQPQTGPMPQPGMMPQATPFPQAPPHGHNQVFYVDFLPSCINQGGMLSSPTYEPFATLIARANEYLRANPGFKVIQCESSEKRYNYWEGGINLDRSTYLNPGKRAIAYLRNLRLWCRASPDASQPQQLSYINVLPACTSSGGFLSQPTYENFNQTIEKVNAMLKSNPLQGKILNIETQDITMTSVWSDFRVDPERTYFVERGHNSYVSCIRVFYICGPPCYEMLGAADFAPMKIGENKVLLATIPNFEPFVNVVMRATQWAQQQTTVNFTNVQSLECKYHYWGAQQVNTQEMFYFDASNRSITFVSFVRVYYTMMPSDSPFTNPRPLNLTYRTFEPVQLGPIGFSMGFTQDLPFESQSQTLQRANAWLQQTGANVISAETIPIRMMRRQPGLGSGSSQHYGSENTYTYEGGDASVWYLFVLRFYFDGAFAEPPPHMLPPAPEVQRYTEQECCHIL